MKNITAAEMIKALGNIGKEWHKGDMHRYYIELSVAYEMYSNLDDSAKCLPNYTMPINRFEKGNGKVWIDIESGEIKTKDIRNGEGVVDCIMALIESLIVPDQAVEEEIKESEESEATIWYAVVYDSEDNDYGTGSFSLSEAKAQARAYRDGAFGEVYPEAHVVAVDDSDGFALEEIYDLDD